MKIFIVLQTRKGGGGGKVNIFTDFDAAGGGGG